MTRVVRGHFDFNPFSSFSPKQHGDLQWLFRYVKHTQPQCLDMGFDGIPSYFSRPAWRVVCRSSRKDFLPLIRNTDLSFKDLVEYCERLVLFGFRSAPASQFLALLLDQMRLYFDRPCRIPEEQDYLIMRIAARESKVTQRDMVKIFNWAAETRTEVRSCHRWSGLRKRANQHFHQQRVRYALSRPQWEFNLTSALIDGYDFVALSTPADLWEEGEAMRSCVFKLRNFCDAPNPSRFFSIRYGSKRVATLELVLLPSVSQLSGTWMLQDLRRSFNRPPSPQLTSLALKFTAAYDPKNFNF
jgi:hypothetical protein